MAGSRRALPAGVLDGDTPEEQVASFVDAVVRERRDRHRLVELLPEQIPLYAGRGTRATSRLRGWVLAAFERVGLPDAALPYVLEELQSGRDAYLVAAAAKAVRGLAPPPDGIAEFLLTALGNVRYVDDALSFGSYRPHRPAAPTTSAAEELMLTLAWLGPAAAPVLPALRALHEDRHAVPAPARAVLGRILSDVAPAPDHCCGGPALPGPLTTGPTAADAPLAAVLQDQDGTTVGFGEFFLGRPSVVAFFYTRCDNPNKCSLTVTKLARLHRARRGRGLDGRVRSAAITYDPAYDLPPRLWAYGHNRGVEFGADDRFLRSTSGFDELSAYFELGVNFGPTLVNRHRIELFVLDADGHIAATFARLQWDESDVLDRAALLAVRRRPRRTGRRRGT